MSDFFWLPVEPMILVKNSGNNGVKVIGSDRSWSLPSGAWMEFEWHEGRWRRRNETPTKLQTDLQTGTKRSPTSSS